MQLQSVSLYQPYVVKITANYAWRNQICVQKLQSYVLLLKNLVKQEDFVIKQEDSAQKASL
jgi:hypothetical protein